MSEFGIQIKNNNNEMVIDGKSKCFGLYNIGSNMFINNDGTISGYHQLVNFSATTSNPTIVLLRPGTDRYVQVESMVVNGLNFSGFYAVTERNNSTNADFKIYSAHPPINTMDYGLSILNENNEVVFGSNNDYFKITQAQTANLVLTANASSLVVHTEISNPYYILSPMGYSWLGKENPGGYNQWYRIGLKKVDATSVMVGRFLIFSGAGNFTDFEHYNPTYNIIICDVD